MKTQILVNRGGGSADDRSAVADALAGAGIHAEPQWLDGGDIAAAARAAVDSGAELVIAGGGDGTLSAVAGVLAGTPAKLGILPLGTLNHFARDLEIPLDLGKAAKLIAKAKKRLVDVAEINGRTFINNSAVGIYPLMVTDRESQQHRLGRRKRLATVVAAVRTLLRFSHHRLTITINGKSSRIDTPLLFVGNNLYRLELPEAGTRESLDRGKLCVLVLRSTSRLGFCTATVRSLLGRARPTDLAQLKDVEKICVDSRRSMLTISIDGETVRFEPPLYYRIRPKALAVIAP